ncbi:MAG: hypothetical protein LBQ77_04625 [Treponema sp.]|jgi:hypothetical protein|nr:hypothetical protein [Treponema sp.]
MRFIVLIPHRDSCTQWHAYKQSLFAQGLYGAFSFPIAAPLAIVSRPYTPQALKTLAAQLHKEKHLTTAPPLTCRAFDRQYYWCGPALSGLTLPDSLPEGIIIQPLFLCVALSDSPVPDMPHVPPLSFRVAALANCLVVPLKNRFSYRWFIGKRQWL